MDDRSSLFTETQVSNFILLKKYLSLHLVALNLQLGLNDPYMTILSLNFQWERGLS